MKSENRAVNCNYTLLKIYIIIYIFKCYIALVSRKIYKYRLTTLVNHYYFAIVYDGGINLKSILVEDVSLQSHFSEARENNFLALGADSLSVAYYPEHLISHMTHFFDCSIYSYGNDTTESYYLIHGGRKNECKTN